MTPTGAEGGMERVPVRSLVEFSVFGEDIVPLSPELLEEGRRGHLARQKKSAAEEEVPLTWRGEACGLSFIVSGRMDLYDAQANPPLIEEIKLTRGGGPPAPLPAHLAQARCYGHMLCQREGLSEVRLRVSYVTASGDPVATHDARCAAEDLKRDFLSLLEPYALWRAGLRRHLAARDLSAAALAFPYECYRSGQREMAAQVYTAIRRRRKLFALMPTGTGKSAAVLYPAMKALGEGLTGQIFYLTARTTARRAALAEVARMRAGGLKAKALTLGAKEKLCPTPGTRCHPDACSRAKGHYLRQKAALGEAMGTEDWDVGAVLEICGRHCLCPFEFSLALCEVADLVICDYNYALDPQVYIRRIFDSPGRLTLLIDEAHNLADRVREMLSGELDGDRLLELRRAEGREHGRRTPLYRAASELIRALRETSAEAGSLGDAVLRRAEALLDALSGPGAPPDGAGFAKGLVSFLAAAGRMAERPDEHRLFVGAQGRLPGVRVFCLEITRYLLQRLRRLRGCVFFSAALTPLDGMRSLLGGDEEDACFELPSPFPEGNLRVLLLPLNTRYRFRDETLGMVCEGIAAMFFSRPGKYIAFFPSYEYLRAAAARLGQAHPSLPLHVQLSGMGDGEREEYLRRFTLDGQPLLGLCVLGGVFAEGIDLPGLALIGACVVGVGLPQVNRQQEALREHYDRTLGDGFAYAYRYPGMHKVLQAAGRVIRSETDRGGVLLMDDRYRQDGYASLLPGHYHVQRIRSPDEIAPLMQEFWSGAGK